MIAHKTAFVKGDVKYSLHFARACHARRGDHLDGLFFKLSLFERESCKEKQQAWRRLTSLLSVRLCSVRSPARACSHEHIVRPPVRRLRDASLVGRRIFALCEQIFMFALLSLRRGSAVSLLKRNVSGRRKRYIYHFCKVKSDKPASFLLLFRSFSFKKKKNNSSRQKTDGEKIAILIVLLLIKALRGSGGAYPQ